MNPISSLFARLGAGPKNRASRILAHAVAMTALVFLLIASGTGITLALWSSQDTLDSSASRANLQVSVETDNLDFTFANHRLSNTGSFTVTNSTVTESETPASYSIAVASEGDSELAAALAVTVWQVDTATACASEAIDPTLVGTWGSFPGVSGSLTAGKTHSYCVSSVVSTGHLPATVDASWTIKPTITAIMTIGSWSAIDRASATLKAEWVAVVIPEDPKPDIVDGARYTVRNAGNTGNEQCVTRSGDSNALVGAVPCEDEWLFTATGNAFFVSLAGTSGSESELRWHGEQGNRKPVKLAGVGQKKPEFQTWTATKQSDGSFTFQHGGVDRCISIVDSLVINEQCNAKSVAQRFVLTKVVEPFTSSLSVEASDEKAPMEEGGSPPVVETPLEAMTVEAPVEARGELGAIPLGIIQEPVLLGIVDESALEVVDEPAVLAIVDEPVVVAIVNEPVVVAIVNEPVVVAIVDEPAALEMIEEPATLGGEK